MKDAARRAPLHRPLVVCSIDWEWERVWCKGVCIYAVHMGWLCPSTCLPLSIYSSGAVLCQCVLPLWCNLLGTHLQNMSTHKKRYLNAWTHHTSAGHCKCGWCCWLWCPLPLEAFPCHAARLPVCGLRLWHTAQGGPHHGRVRHTASLDGPHTGLRGLCVGWHCFVE